MGRGAVLPLLAPYLLPSSRNSAVLPYREIVFLVKRLKYETITAYFALGVNSSWSK